MSISTRRFEQASYAAYVLVFISLSWGLTFPLISLSVQEIAPPAFVLYRFTIATCLLFPLVFKELPLTTKRLLLGTATLGVLNFASYYLQTLGLQTIQPNESAFITSSSVVLIPLLSVFFGFDKPRTIDHLCSLICLAGVYILTGANINQINQGEFLTLLSAVCFALAIILLQILSKQFKQDNLIAFYQLAFTALFAIPMNIHINHTLHFTFTAWVGILFCALFATALSFFLQSRYQKYVSLPKVALIFSLEPLFASFFSWLINHDKLSANFIAGGCCIFISIILPDLIAYQARRKLVY